MIVNSYYSSGYIHRYILYIAPWQRYFLGEGFRYIQWPENCLFGSLFEKVNGYDRWGGLSLF